MPLGTEKPSHAILVLITKSLIQSVQCINNNNKKHVILHTVKYLLAGLHVYGVLLVLHDEAYVMPL